MSVSSLANFFSFFTASQPPPPPKAPFIQLPLSPTDSHSSSSRPNQDSLFPLASKIDNNQTPLRLSCSNSDITCVVCPSLAYANTLFFKSGYNAEIIVEDDESEEQLIGRFRREVIRAGVIPEVRRRRHFENKQEKVKRKAREAGLRNRRRRGPPREDDQETSKNQRDADNDDEVDNWEYRPVGNILS